MPRTTLGAVQAILGGTTTVSNWDGVTSLQPYIDKATLMVDRVRTCAIASDTTLTTAELEMIERWLSAYYYTVMDPLYTQRSTLSASGGFGRKQQGVDYLDAAIESDPTGCLAALVNKLKPDADWTGKTEDESIPVWDR